MAILPSSAGLLCAGIVFLTFGLLNIIMPVSFLRQYNLDLDNINTTVTDNITSANITTAITTDEKMITSSTLQLVGVHMFVSGSCSTVTYRGGSDQQKSAVCLMNGLGALFTVVLGLCTVSYWTDIGVSATGLYINAAIFFVVAVVNFLSVNFPFDIKLSPSISKPLYWGFFVIIPLFVLYMFAFFFAPDFIADSYGLTMSGTPKVVLLGLIRFGFGPALLQNILLFVALIITPGTLATYVIVRMMAFVSFGAVLFEACAAAVWTCRSVNGSYDKIIRGMGFNMFLWTLLFFAFYFPLMQLDNKLKDALEAELAAVPDKKAKKTKKAVEPAAAPEPVAEVQVVQPLLPPLVPLSTSQALVPSYSMFQQAQMTYAPATTAYAAPATYAGAPMAMTTTAYAAPAAYAGAPMATTAYAAPATYSAGVAAPAMYTTGGVV
jgi:hypothetical protein